MKDEVSSNFSRPEFKEALARYQEMRRTGVHVYFEPHELTLIAEYYADQGDIQASDEVIDYALTLYPENLDIQIYKCHNLISQGKSKEAEMLLHAMPDQTDYEVQLLYAEWHLSEGRRYESHKIFGKLYQENPDIDTALDIAQICMDYREKDMAYPWILDAMELDPDDLAATELMATYQYESGNMDEAARLFNILLDDDPYSVEQWQNLADCHMQLEQMDKALEAIEYALAIDENNLTSWALKADWYMTQGEMDEAIKCYNHVEALSKEKDSIWNLLVYMYYDMRDFRKVIEYSDKLIDTYRTSSSQVNWSEIYYKRTISFLALGNQDEAFISIDRGLAYNEHDYRLYLLNGELLLLEKKKEEAEELFEYARRYCFDDKKLRSVIAASYQRAGYYEEALAQYKQLEHDYPDNKKEYCFFIANCHFHLNQQNKAIAYLIWGAINNPEGMESTRRRLFSKQEKPFFDLAQLVLNSTREGRTDADFYPEGTQ